MSEENQPTRAVTVAREDDSTVTIRLRLPRRRPDHAIQAIVLLLYLAALLCALFASHLLRGAGNPDRNLGSDLAAGGPFVWIAIGLWLLAELSRNWDSLRNAWGGLDRLRRICWLLRLLPLLASLAATSRLIDSTTASPETVLPILGGALSWLALAALLWLLIEAWRWWIRTHGADMPRYSGWIQPAAPAPAPLIVKPPEPLFPWRSIPISRIALFALAAFSSAAVWVNTTGNSFRPPIIALWLVSVLLWAWFFAPLNWNPFFWLFGKLSSDLRVPWREYWWAFIAFALIMIFGISFHLTNLELGRSQVGYSSFHSLVDSHRLLHGKTSPIFLTADGGRAVLTFYAPAALATAPGFSLDFYTQKLATALASVLALPLMLWLGIEFHGCARRKLGIVTGLLLAGLVAASAWAALLSRSGHDFGWVPLFAAPLGVFLIRALRHNCRADYILAGLLLSFSLYTYAGARGFTIAVAAAFVVAMLAKRQSWRERSVYLVNFAVLVFITVMVYLPATHYILEYPDQFWKRSRELTYIDLSDAEPGTETLQRVLAPVMNNVRKHLLMFHWNSTRDFRDGLLGLPALDTYTGALLMLGAAALAARMAKSRDPAIWMLPAFLFCFYLQSILVIHPPEQYKVPSNVRTAGALPFIHLLAAIPLTVIARQLLRVFPRQIAALLAALLCGAFLLLAWGQNTSLYFGHYHDTFVRESGITRDGGKIIRGFIDSGGAFGNVFLSFRGRFDKPSYIAAQAGFLSHWNEFWSPGEILPDVASALRREENPLQPDRDLLFMYSPGNQDYTETLRELFPRGYLVVAETIKENENIALYRVPALGEEALNEIVLEANS